MGFETINIENGQSYPAKTLDDAVFFGEQYLIRYQIKESGVVVPFETVQEAKGRILHLCG